MLLYFKRFFSSLTNGGDVGDHEVASLWHDGLQAHTLQTRGQLLPLVVQHRRQLLEVALWSPKKLVFSLKPLSYCLLSKAAMDEKNKTKNAELK